MHLVDLHGVRASDGTDFVTQLKMIVGARNVLTSRDRTRRYRTGFRFGSGNCLAVVRPGSLVEQWKVLQACVAANKIIIMQASNTGLTGGSTPNGTEYDRDVVIISTTRMDQLHLIDEGRQVICFPGTTLYRLESALKPLGREPHSVIGSSCIGASVLGGISNNSGGALVRRGPAFTEMALFARVDEEHKIHLVNHLGVRLGNDPEEILDRLDRHAYSEADIVYNTNQRGHDRDYVQHVRDVQANTPARFNADTRRLFEASGNAGRIVLFAARLDTFPKERETKVFYIGSNDTRELETIRRHILEGFVSMPVAAEYIHRDAFNIAEVYGKDTYLAIQMLGTNFLPRIFAMKARLDTFAQRFGFLPSNLADRLLQFASRFIPSPLPQRLKAYRDKYEHHLLLKMAGAGIAEARAYLGDLFPSISGNVLECTDSEGDAAFLHRFAVASAAVRYRAVHDKTVEDIVALDIALRRNDWDWFEVLPPEINGLIIHKIYYGHFLCHVFHQDYIVRKGVDAIALEHAMWKLLDQRGAEYPAEHNVGHLYPAKPPLRDFYKSLDPTNTLNPGIGQTSKRTDWG